MECSGFSSEPKGNGEGATKLYCACALSKMCPKNLNNRALLCGIRDESSTPLMSLPITPSPNPRQQTVINQSYFTIELVFGKFYRCDRIQPDLENDAQFFVSTFCQELDIVIKVEIG